MGSPTLIAERTKELFSSTSEIPLFDLDLDRDQQTPLDHASWLTLQYAAQRTGAVLVTDALSRKDLSVRVGFVPKEFMVTGYEEEDQESVYRNLGIVDQRPFLDGLAQATLRLSVRGGSLSIDAARQGGVTHGVQLQEAGGAWRPLRAFTNDDTGRYSGRIASPHDILPVRQAASMHHLSRAATAIGEVTAWIVDMQTGPEELRLVPQVEFVGDSRQLGSPGVPHQQSR